MRRRVSVALVAAVVLGGLVVWPASPVAADEVTYEDVPCEDVHETASFDSDYTWTISGEGPSEPVAPGETFTLSDLVVTQHLGRDGHAGELTVLGGQVIDLGVGEGTGSPEFFQEWVVGDVELTAPTDLGTHGINPEATWNRSQTAGESFLGHFCPREGESFPDDPFASVEVADVEPTTTTTTTTTTTVPGDGNGGNGDGNGDGSNGGGSNGDGDGPNGDADPEAEPELEAEAPLLVGASPRFAG